jgi:hypothetical protein
MLLFVIYRATKEETPAMTEMKWFTDVWPEANLQNT